MAANKEDVYIQDGNIVKGREATKLLWEQDVSEIIRDTGLEPLLNVVKKSGNLHPTRSSNNRSTDKDIMETLANDIVRKSQPQGKIKLRVESTVGEASNSNVPSGTPQARSTVDKDAALTEQENVSDTARASEGASTSLSATSVKGSTGHGGKNRSSRRGNKTANIGKGAPETSNPDGGSAPAPQESKKKSRKDNTENRTGHRTTVGTSLSSVVGHLSPGAGFRRGALSGTTGPTAGVSSYHGTHQNKGVRQPARNVPSLLGTRQQTPCSPSPAVASSCSVGSSTTSTNQSKRGSKENRKAETTKGRTSTENKNRGPASRNKKLVTSHDTGQAVRHQTATSRGRHANTQTASCTNSDGSRRPCGKDFPQPTSKENEPLTSHHAFPSGHSCTTEPSLRSDVTSRNYDNDSSHQHNRLRQENRKGSAATHQPSIEVGSSASSTAGPFVRTSKACANSDIVSRSRDNRLRKENAPKRKSQPSITRSKAGFRTTKGRMTDASSGPAPRDIYSFSAKNHKGMTPKLESSSNAGSMPVQSPLTNPQPPESRHHVLAAEGPHIVVDTSGGYGVSCTTQLQEQVGSPLSSTQGIVSPDQDTKATTAHSMNSTEGHRIDNGPNQSSQGNRSSGLEATNSGSRKGYSWESTHSKSEQPAQGLEKETYGQQLAHELSDAVSILEPAGQKKERGKPKPDIPPTRSEAKRELKERVREAYGPLIDAQRCRDVISANSARSGAKNGEVTKGSRGKQEEKPRRPQNKKVHTLRDLQSDDSKQVRNLHGNVHGF